MHVGVMVESLRRHPLLDLPRPWALLRQGAAPTVAHWLEGALEQAGAPILQLDPQRPPAAHDLEHLGAVVVVRTLPRCWLDALSHLRSRGCPVLLLDDDLLTPASLRGSLALSLAIVVGADASPSLLGAMDRWAMGEHRGFAASVCSYHGNSVVLPLQPQLVLDPPRMFRIAYLGTAAHSRS